MAFLWACTWSARLISGGRGFSPLLMEARARVSLYTTKPAVQAHRQMGRGGETLCGAVEGAQDCVYESSHPLPQGSDRQLQLNIGLESHVY